jgi:putative ABC transport system permease protein
MEFRRKLKKNNTMWIKNYKQAFTYLINHKTYSLVVIIGLAVGIAASFLIYSYVFYEKSFDNFHLHGDNLYRVSVTCQSEELDPYKSPYSYAPQGMVAVDEIPEVENYVRLMAGSKVVITSIGNETVKMLTESNYYYADEAFFELFSFPLIYGTPKNVLKDPGTVVLSRSTSDKLFGTQNPVGKEIKIDGKNSWRVTGVFEDIPENTHLKFNMLFSLNTFSWIMSERNAWSNHSFFTYFLLKEGADQKEVESKITKAYLKENRAINQSECSWELQAIADAYLDTNDFTSKPKAFKFGNKRVVYFLSLIAILILCIAWANYINLSSAKETEREKEILVRKTFGAGKFQLILQFFLESILYNFISILLAIVIVTLVFNWFISTMSFSFLLWSNTGFWITIGSFLAIGVLLSACLTSISMSKLDPLKSDNSVNKSNSKSNFRNGLVIFQLVIIILLIVGVGFVNKQLTYLHSVDLGFQKEQILVLLPLQLVFRVKGLVMEMEDLILMDRQIQINTFVLAVLCLII